ncbi:MAG: peptide chain release factor N(5)-glutamine methyltransferase, partial [Bdellovibrionales bacterium]|nr:peptide chain release factor N(5)-glutamine methyltransferase [Bdellovibrionales bacterium]
MAQCHELLMQGCAELLSVSPSARLDSELLLAHLLGKDRAGLIAADQEAIDSDLEHRFKELIAKRKLHVPIAYLVGCKEFYGYDFNITSDVLIPRPETEMLVDMALERSKGFPDPVRLLDLGTGSGCIVVAICKQLRDQGRLVQAVALDKHAAALSVAERNIVSYNLQDVIKLQQSDWLSELKPFADVFDIIVSNPPYVALDAEGLSPELKYEPVHALFAKQAGLDDIERILTHLQAFMDREGVFLCEIGADQGSSVLNLARNYFPGQDIQIHHDLAGKA